MRLQDAPAGNDDVTRFSGDIDFHYSRTFRSILRAKLQQHRPLLILDFSEVDYIDSSGMAALVEYIRDAQAFGGRLAMVGLNDRLKRVFEIVRLSEYLPSFQNYVEARSTEWEPHALGA
jgi:anti-sigma B factor antagonist